MLFPLAELIAHRRITTVQHDARVSDALHTMIGNDFSFVPVVDVHGKLTGVISEQVIVRKYYHFGGDKLLFDLAVKDCQTRAVTLPPTADIFDALRPLETSGAVIVVEDGKPIGIVTDFDTTHFFREYSQGIILCQDIEFNLRRHIEDVFPLNSADLTAALMAAFGHNRDQRLAGRPATEYDELSLWQHVLLITTDANWVKFNDALAPKPMFLKLMEPVRKARNQISHFRGELTPVQIDALSQARYWLEHRPVSSTLRGDVPPAVDVTANDADSSGTAPGDTAPKNDASSAAGVHGVDEQSNGDAPAAVDTATVPLPDDDVPARLAQESDLPNGRQQERTEHVVPEYEQHLEGKYAPLTRWLRSLSEEQAHVRVDFREIEKVIGESLPPSARSHSNWWANDSTNRRQSIAWLRAGWRVEAVDPGEGKVVFRRANTALMQSFFADVLARFKEVRPEATRATKTQPQGWFNFGAGKTGFVFSWMFGYAALRVELYIDTTEAADNKTYFTMLAEQRPQIEAELGMSLTWDPMEKRRAARIYIDRSAEITDAPEQLEAYKTWAVETMARFVDVFQPRVRAL